MALLLATNPETTELVERARALRNFFLLWPLQVLPRCAPDLQHVGVHPGIALWLMPAAMGTVFVALFAAANPAIEQRVSLLNRKLILDYVSIPCDLFWTMMLALVWPFIHLRWRRRTIATTTGVVDGPVPPPLPPFVFARSPRDPQRFPRLTHLFTCWSLRNHPRWYRSLGACRAADQFDLCGLCPSRRLSADRDRTPRRRLRAGGDAPGRSGGEIERSSAAGVSLGGQNVLLVASSILRLDLYVDIYMLTYWRIAASIWMGLVALGLFGSSPVSCSTGPANGSSAPI